MEIPGQISAEIDKRRLKERLTYALTVVFDLA
jgi:hypothetical protein